MTNVHSNTGAGQNEHLNIIQKYMPIPNKRPKADLRTVTSLLPSTKHFS